MHLLMKIKRNYVLIPLAVIVVGALGSIFTNSGMDWYDTLLLPVGTPDGSVIGTIWTIIYTCCIVSLLILWNKTKHDHDFMTIMGLFLINWILNAGRCWVFFSQHWLGLAAWLMVVIFSITLLKIILIWPRHKLASLLLVPYPLWVALAGGFAFKIWMLN